MATKKVAKKAVKPKAAKHRVKIRMYRQGLGDCFLLSFPRKGKKPYQLMIDCGVVLGTPEPAAVMKSVAADIKKETKGVVDALVITHEHWDHLSGFTKSQAQDEFASMKFGELWMAWTEDSKNLLANQLRKEREAKKATVGATVKKLTALKADAKRVERLSSLLGFNGGKSGTTDEAFAFLKASIPNQQCLLPGGTPLTLPGVDDVRIYVLGPPEQKSMLRKKDPGKQGYAQLGLSEVFSAALADGSPELTEAAQPFESGFRLNGRPRGYLTDDWRSIEDDWLGVGERLALQLDADTNNTSLVLAFEFISTGEVLLFVGDAQAGNWLSWDGYSWNVKNADGEKVSVTAAQLMERTVVYKVGHHGSHNATLREKGLERMKDTRLVALMPVDEQVAHEKKGWMHMPLPSLVKRLQERSAVLLRSDSDKMHGKPQRGIQITAQKLFFDIVIP